MPLRQCAERMISRRILWLCPSLDHIHAMLAACANGEQILNHCRQHSKRKSKILAKLWLYYKQSHAQEI
jgi:hypothetical protein